MSSRASLGSTYEHSISIEDTSDSDSEFEQQALSSGKGASERYRLETDINKLKAESSSKFKRRWDEIIAKFSAIDDEKESDEIDLHSGKITVDNGHLRSLRSSENVVDGVKVHSSIWAGDYDFDKQLRHQKRRQESASQNKHELKQKLKAEKRFHNSKLVTSDSDALEDNLSILGSSPTKRIRNDPGSDSSLLDSPFSTSSPLKYPSQGTGSSPLKNRIAQTSPGGSPKKHTINHGLRQRQSSGTQDSQSHIDQSPDSSFEQNSLSDWHQAPELALYTCAFRDCRVVSESRSSYRLHLLKMHLPELQGIGYPVVAPSQTETPFVDEITILKLNLHFPLQADLPTSGPTVCGMDVGGRPCKKLFFNTQNLNAHRRANPISCSSRRQVLPCPILGCAFMTDVGFSDYRKHVLDHHGKCTPRFKLDSDPMEADVSDYFSDSVSSLSFSDSEPEHSIRNDAVHSKGVKKSSHPKKLSSSLAKYQDTVSSTQPRIRPPPSLDIVD